MNSTDTDFLQPPDDLEQRVIARLHAAGLLHGKTTGKETSMRAIHMRWAVAATVLVAISVWAGTLVPQNNESAVTETAAVDARPHFALMLYEDAGLARIRETAARMC